MQFFDEESLNECVEYLSGTDALAGFNTRQFDLGVLEATAQQQGITCPAWPECHIDILDLIVQAEYGGMNIPEAKAKYGPSIFAEHRKLDDVAWATIHELKSGSGAHAPLLWRAGRIAELYSYCARDVWLEHKLVQFALRHRYVIDGRGAVIRLDDVLAAMGV